MQLIWYHLPKLLPYFLSKENYFLLAKPGLHSATWKKHGKNGEKWTKNAHFFKNYPRNVVYTVLKYNVTPVNGLVQLHYTSKYPDSLLMTNITSKIWEKMSKNEQNWHIFEKNWHIFEKNCFLLLYKAWYKKRFWNGIGKTCILGSIPYF